MKVEDNELELGGVKCSELLKEFGSPLYVYEEDVIRSRVNELKQNISAKIYYACKANTNLAVMKMLREEGCCVDAVSPGEVFLALKAGFDASEILYTGDMVTDSEMRLMVDKGIMVNIGSLSQLKRYSDINPGSKICVRINPDIGAGHHDHTITGGPESKFGIYFDQISKIKAAAHNVKIVGLHTHIGSGILEPSKFLDVMKVMFDVAKQFDDLEFVDFGGGLGVPYKPDDKQLDVVELGSQMDGLFKGFCDEYGKEVEMFIEPGRFIMAESGFLLAKVNTIKETPTHKFVGINTGFNHLLRPMAYGSYHEVINASNVSGEKENVVVAGNICESGDIFTRDSDGAKDREISKIEEGDILAIANAGAYGYSMSSNYNSRLRPAEVLVKDGKGRLVRARESYDDLVKGQ